MTPRNIGQNAPNLASGHTSEVAADSSLDRVLHALQDVQPGEGFHDRLLAGLEHAAEAPSTHAYLTASWRQLLYGAGLALLTVVLGAMLLPRLLLSRPFRSESRPSPHLQTKSGSSSPNFAVKTTAAPATPVTFSLGITNSARRRAATPVSVTDGVPPVPAASMPPPVKLTGSDLPTQAALDSQALDDLGTTSQPAPMNGPTQQEQAVRHMLERDGSAQLAQLEQTRDPVRVAQERAAFHHFFEPKPIRMNDEDSPDPARSAPPVRP